MDVDDDRGTVQQSSGPHSLLHAVRPLVEGPGYLCCREGGQTGSIEDRNIAIFSDLFWPLITLKD